MSKQLSLSFNDDLAVEYDKRRYWYEYFGFNPRCGDLARIGIPISYCETLGRNGYCHCMRVKILEMTDTSARVETTEEWQNACSGATDGVNAAGNVWVVGIEDLTPIFNRKN